MVDEKKFLVDVGMRGLPFPMRVISRAEPDGQFTIAHISITARIMQEFEARWIDRFVQIVHEHRDRIGTQTLRVNIMDYLNTEIYKRFNEEGIEIPFPQRVVHMKKE